LAERDNTFCVARQVGGYTICSVHQCNAAQHNSCMADQMKQVRKESGIRIKRVRMKAGLTQKELAEKTGFREARDIQPSGALTPSRIGNYEQGTRWIGWDEALVLSRIFPDYHPAYFLAVITEQEARVLKAMESPDRTRSPIPFKPTTPKEDRAKDGHS
jgi:transcriptional regulator with XRE-family HTH domain